MTLEQANLVAACLKQVCTTKNVRITVVGYDPLTNAPVNYTVDIQKGGIKHPDFRISIDHANAYVALKNVSDLSKSSH